MGMVLSIYSQKGFREVTLPERGQDELEILLQKELFALEQDIRLVLEKQGDEWELEFQNATIISGAADKKRVQIQDGSRFEADGGRGDRITVISFVQKTPFSVYRKYALSGLQEITIGRKAGNVIQYENDFVSGEHCSIVIEGGTAKLCDKSTNGTYLNFKRVYGSTILSYGDSIRVMRLNIIYLGNMIAVDECDHLNISLTPLETKEIQSLAGPLQEGGSHHILFRRSPRELEKLYTEPFEIEAPPNPPNSQETPLAMTIGPALTMTIPMLLGSAVTIWANRSSGAVSGAFMYMGMITAIASALIGTMWALLNVRHGAKMRKREENRRFERYGEYLIRMRDRIEKAHNENAAVLNRRYLSAPECAALNEHSSLLWNRNEFHEDFLAVRLGIGDIPFQAAISIPKERFTLVDDTLSDKPQVIQDNFRTLHKVPVTVDLLQNRLVGIAGGENRRAAIEIAKAMIAQLATANCYTDVKLAIVCDGGNDIDRETWDFAMWLPHVWSSDKKIRYIATNKTEIGDVFHALTQVLRTREEEKEGKKGLKPRFILFVAEPRLLDGEAIAHYVFDRDNNLGLSTVLLAARPEDLPNECECIVEQDGQYQGVYSTRTGRADGIPVRFDSISGDSLKNLAKRLGRIEVIESEQEGEIPNALTFFDMFGVSRPDGLNAAERWKKANSIVSMKALVGFRSGNTPCYLDIHERYHGPHGLVAGTTGSGKSETLQTYILSLAVNFSPEDVGFFIIDYKGGGMANLFDGLPHMIGSISNLSGGQVKRAMVSIQSENRRRQRIFTEYGVNNINGYTALYKSGDAVEPVPHLFIIIDEFAELKREEPEFMKELISVAQVGRSLGVHLILSTQRPSGTVDENIWANSKFRLCLRVQDRQDSMDMLHRTEAAYLTQAGRCYLQVGNDEIFELFQSGWSGASYDEELGGSLLIAQMLSATGKVDLAGNHAKVKRKEELKRRWVGQLVDILRATQEETGIYVAEAGFQFGEVQEFRERFYQKLSQIQPDFEENQFNTTRIGDFCSVYQELADVEDDSQLVVQLIRLAAREGKRLPEVKSRTQLEVTVDYLRSVAEELGVEKIRKLWLPVLPDFLYLDSLDTYARSAFDGSAWQELPRRFQLSAVIGMADDPANQAQMPVSLDFARGGHHMVIGTVSTGKSTLLQTVVYSLVSCYTPELLNIYCLDFSAKLLSVFSGLKHVGGYLDEGDLDNDGFGKFFTMMSRILDERKELFAGTSFADYVNHNGWTVPAILIVIDNYGSFHDKTGETYETNMMRLAKEGVSCGVYLLVSAGGIGMQELPGRLAENFRTGVSLEMQDSFAYADVLRVIRPPVLPEGKVKGRGLMYCGERILEFQTALAAHAEDGPKRIDLLKESVARMNAAYPGPRARAIPCIPENPVRADFTDLPEYGQLLAQPERMPAGYDFEFADIYSFDLVENYIFLVTGAKKSGKSVFMENLMLTGLDRGDEIAVLEIDDNRFERISQEKSLTRCTDAQAVYDFLARIHGELISRAAIKKACIDQKASPKEMFTAALQNRRIDIFIGNMTALIQQLHNPESPAFNAQGLFETLCERGMGYNIFLYGEVSDREEKDLMGYTCFDSMRSYRSGIRFGGRVGEQKLFPFENVSYQEQDRSAKCGVGMIPSENREDRQIKVIVPMC